MLTNIVITCKTRVLLLIVFSGEKYENAWLLISKLILSKLVSVFTKKKNAHDK